MLDRSRTNLYAYLYDMFYGTVSENVYRNEPQELLQSDTEDGFLVISVGEINDASEFTGEAYGWAHCYVEAYIPLMSRGRVDIDKYRQFEVAIDAAIEKATQDSEGTYFVEEGTVLSADEGETTNANNAYFVFVKSFVVNINK